MRILVLATHDQNRLLADNARIIGAAKKLGGEIDMLVVGHNVRDVAKNASKLEGVNKILLLDDKLFSRPFAQLITPLLVQLADNYSHIITSSNSVGRNIFPRLAAKLDLMPITDVIKIHSINCFDRPIYAGNAIETVKNEQAKTILTIRASEFEKVGQEKEGEGEGEGKIENIKIPKLAINTSFIEEYRTKSDSPDLTTASIVVAGGRAIGSKENFALVKKLAKKLNAAIGATRAAVDLGYAPNDWQIGQTGKVIAPKLYIAIGISGALQHIAGISGAKKIVAINDDIDAPMVKIADYSLIGDLNEILPDLISRLKQK